MSEFRIIQIGNLPKREVDFELKCQARRLFNSALVTGKLIRVLQCEGCLQFIRTQGHHSDYRRALDVVWLCSKCHGAIHRQS